MRTFENAEREMSKGNLWRAKEILECSIPNCGYNCELFERFGVVLLAMGDLPVAGKFLFLSGERKDEYEQAISIFLLKYQKNPPALYRTFPRPARLAALSEYPGTVRSELTRLGLPEILKRDGPAWNSRHSASVVVSLIIGLILLVFVLGIIKIVEIVRWLIS